MIYIKSFLSKCILFFLKIPGLVQGHNETCPAYLNAILHIGASKVKKNQVKNYEADSYGWIHALWGNTGTKVNDKNKNSPNHANDWIPFMQQ